VALLVGQWAFDNDLLPWRPTLSDIRARVIMDGRPEFLAAQPQFTPVEGAVTWREWPADRRLVLEFLSRVSHKGSDVRITTGQVMDPAMWPRAAIDPAMWAWQLVVKWSWEWTAHINILEGRAALAMMKWRLRRSGGIGRKYLHLLDSQVCIAIFTKRRSSSRLLNAIARRMSSLELAASSHPLYGFARSDTNPADAPSR
jgi:hypothetical protein